MLKQNAAAFSELISENNLVFVHFYEAAETKPLWDSMEGLFLHMQIKHALWNKLAG